MTMDYLKLTYSRIKLVVVRAFMHTIVFLEGEQRVGKVMHLTRHHHRHHHSHKRQRVRFIRLTVGDDTFQYSISFAGEVFMGIKVQMGHSVSGKITFLDQHGNPMLTPVVPDAAPGWAQVDANVESLTPSADGLSMSATPLKEGVDTISVTVLVGGQSFTATLDVEVVAEPQVLTSVAIEAIVS